MGVVYVNGVSELMGCRIADASAGPGRRVSCHRGLNRGVVPHLWGSPAQHRAAGDSVHSHGSTPCPGVYSSLPLLPTLPLPAGAGGQCRGFGQWGTSSITSPVATPQLAPWWVVMPGMFIALLPALLSQNWSGHLVVPHLRAAEALAALDTEPDLPGGCRQRAGKAGGEGCAC